MRVLNTLRIAAVATAAAIVAGCHGLPEKTDETATWTNQKLYSEAQDAFTAGDWDKCSKYFELLQGRDPFGHFAQQAQINVAYCQWKDNETAAAEQSVNRFIQLHPDHPDVAYAYYLKGLITFNDDLGLFGRFAGQDMSERDPKALRDSYDAFRVVVDKYPSSNPYRGLLLPARRVCRGDQPRTTGAEGIQKRAGDRERAARDGAIVSRATPASARRRCAARARVDVSGQPVRDRPRARAQKGQKAVVSILVTIAGSVCQR
ncbi:hypothetical protein DFQ30_010474 [Apophysomyces sp. BC1015]|nr:hypothetical protein DFQ30_010474 [Apophysomyces sp. BC1015]